MSERTRASTLSHRQEATRQAIVDAAHTEFLAQGYGGATLASVAARAGLSTATLHKYFPTKRELFGGVMERFWSSGADLPVLTADPATSLLRLGSAYTELLLPQTTPALFRVVIAETIRHPELGQELYERGKKPYLARLEAYLRRAVAEDMLVVDDIPLAVRQFLGMINDVVFWPRLLVADLVVTRADAERVVSSAVATFLARHGVPGGRTASPPSAGSGGRTRVKQARR